MTTDTGLISRFEIGMENYLVQFKKIFTELPNTTLASICICSVRKFGIGNCRN